MSNDKNKVEYGLDRVTLFELKEDDAGKVTYGDPYPLDGAVSFTADKEGDQYAVYADNGVWFKRNNDNGYSGTYTVMNLTDEDRIFIFGDERDGEGAIVEVSNAPTKRFGVALRCEGDAAQVVHQFFDVSFERPSLDANTIEESIEVSPLSMNYTAVPIEVADGKRAAKRRFVKGDAGYANALTSMALPTFEATA